MTIVFIVLYSSINRDILQPWGYNSTCFTGKIDCWLHTVCELTCLTPTGIPDGPRNCNLLYLNSSTSVIECLPGFSGGEPPEFAVYRTSPGTEATRLDTSVMWEGEMVHLVSQGLLPNSNYTLLVYGENVHGQSHDAFGLYVRTPGTCRKHP